jgi:hypothetical protein
LKSLSFSSAALAAIVLLALPPGAARAAVPAPDRADAVLPGADWDGRFRPLDLLYAESATPARPSPDAASSRVEPTRESAAALRLEGDPDRQGAGPKSSRKALLFSMLLPGAGELYLGHRGRALGFFVSEGGIWANYAAWEISGHLRKNDYIEQAQINAGVGISSASDDYWRLLGQYQRSSGTGPDAYEETVRREARLQYPDDPGAQDEYVAQRLPTGKRAWSWSSASLQSSYVETRRSANRAFEHAKVSFALAILNRLVSAVDTQILSHSRRADGQSSRDETSTRILTAVTADGGGALLIQRRF